MLLPPPLLLSLFFSIPILASAQQISDSTISFQTDSSSDSSRNPLSASFMNITFSPSQNNERICSARPTNNSQALSIAIRTLPQTKACFDLVDTFSDPETTYNSDGTGRCDSRQGLCGIRYTVFNTPSSSDSDDRGKDTIENQDWSNIFYTQVRNPLAEGDEEEGEGSGGRLELEVFNKEGCESSGDHGSARWNCVDARGSCGGLGFGVKSFRVELMEAEDVGEGSCVVGATGGVNGRARASEGYVAVALALGAGIAVAWM